MIVDQVLIQFVDRQEPQLAFGALAHPVTLARRITAAILCALLCAALWPSGAGAQARDPLRERQWHLDTVRAEDAWRAGRGSGITVAVVDTGVDASHPDLAGRVRGGIDMVDNDSRPDDPNGHGTLVAGVIAAVAGNGIGVVGAAPDTTILPVRVLDARGDGSAADVARGVRWAADNGAHIINLSLAEVPGLLSGLNGLLGSDLEEAIRYADQRGALVVAAAGNDGRSSTPYRNGLPLLIVGATDRSDRVWASSNRDSRTVFAPGVGIISTWHSHGYGEANGTSFATPIVSAAAAILRAQGHDAAETRRRIEAAGTPVGAGRGRIDMARAAGVSPGPSPTATRTASPSPSATAPPGASPSPVASPQPDGSPPPPGAAAPEQGGGEAPPPGGDGAGVVEPVDPGPDVRPVEPDGGIGDGAPPLEVVDGGPGAGSQRDAGRWIGLAALLAVLAAFAWSVRRRP